MNARSPLVLAAVLALAAPPARAVQVWTASATEKIRPATAARSASSAEISAARNEFEAFQIALTGGAVGVAAAASDLLGPGGAIPVRLYREAYITLQNASSLDGGTGSWPDALVPAVDEIVGEPRNAFPFDVPDGETRAIWAEVHVPADMAPGAYAGTVAVTWSGGGATVPVTLTVWPFVIPSTASLKSTFGLTYGALPAEHGVTGDAFSSLRARYGQLGLEHRVSVSKIDDGNFDLAHLTGVYGGELDGTLPTALEGARLTSFQYTAGAYQDWASWFDGHGWADRLFQYTRDEPQQASDWAAIPPAAALAHATVPPMRTLVTTSIQAAMANGVADVIDLLVPVVNFMDDRPGTGSGYEGDQRPAYDAFLAGSPARELWLYQSCMSHGCGGSATDPYFVGWPTYMIDASATRNRAMEWLSFKYRATGELYYETCMAYGQDPWTNQWAFNGNGDGTLFYPGTVARIGGTTDIPIASIRLKMIREGMEDYEYLKILEDAGDGAFAHQVVDGLFPEAYQTDVSPDALLAARATLADRIVALGLAGSGSGGGGSGSGGGGSGSGGGGSGSGGGDGSGGGSTAPGVPVASGCASGSDAGILALAGLAALVARRRWQG